jgi:DNA-binding MarR family transcriptional regulator
MASPLDLGILLGLAYQTFTDELREQLEAQGFNDLGSSYGYVFRALGSESLHLRVLARRLGMTDQGASKIIDEMEARGYVERRVDPDDGRVKQLRLAKRGRAALSAARHFHAQYEARLRADHGDRAVDGLRRMLETFIARNGQEPAALRAF